MTDNKQPADMPPEASEPDVREAVEASDAASVSPETPCTAFPESGVAAGDGQQEPAAIVRVYQDLHYQCGRTLAASLAGEHGQAVAESHVFAHELEQWATAISPNKEKYLLEVASREYQCGHLALVQGLYRQAFKGLRLVLELCLQAVHLSTHQVELEEWLDSRKDTVWPVLVDADSGVLSVRYARAFFPDLENDVQQHCSLAKKLYRECSECVHGTMQKHIPLPDSIAFTEESFELWHRMAHMTALVVSFSLSLRYLRDMTPAASTPLEHAVQDRLGHMAAIRRHYGGPEGD